MPPPILLLPPSEGKAGGGGDSSYAAGSLSFGELDRDRGAVMKALRKAMTANIASRGKLLGVKGDALAAATAANRAIPTAPTMPAIERYTGVLYDSLDHASLPATSRRRAAGQVVIFSALWGVLMPEDPIPDYKLKIGASLPPLGRVATWWRPRITAALSPLVEGRTVWDLLPNDHASAWAPDPAALGRRISVKFLDEDASGGMVAVAHWNKLLKGAVVRHVLATQLDDPDGLEAFDHPLGYVYRPSLTREVEGRIEVSLVAPR